MKNILFLSILFTLIYCNCIVISAGDLSDEFKTLDSSLYEIINYDDINTKFNSIHKEYIELEYIETYEDPTLMTNLNTFQGTNININDFNDHIRNNSPENSPFIDKGEMFINIGYELDVNPYYIYAHAALESGHGMSNMCKTKGNYFGIGAYNSSPESALSFDKTSMYSSIYNGTKWIKDNYFNKGQDSLYLMLYGNKSYAVYDNGEPNVNWANNILSLMI